jgi:transposase InsO family protein
MDCFFIGRLSGNKGSVWQYTAIDVASGYTWAELHSSERNPRSQYCQRLPHRLAHELALAGWKLNTATTDNGSEFASSEFRRVVEAAGARQRRIKAGCPTSNRCVERVQLTILEESWRASFARSLVPKLTALRRDLDEYLRYYNTDRAHTGRYTQGRVPAKILYGARKMETAR